MRLLLLLIGILVSLTAGAQEELRASAGTTYRQGAESTYGWEADYAQGFGEHAYLSLGWLNEGHLPNNYRDGFTAQLWAHTDISEPRLSFALGIGPYVYFDSSRDTAGPSYGPYSNQHGLGLIYSAELTWYMDQPWFMYLRTNRIEAQAHLSTMMFLVGLGYQFDAPSIPGAPSTAWSPSAEPLDQEVTIFLGRTTLNSFGPERSTAFALEYRRRLAPPIEWTVGWLNEGGNDIIRRNGITGQFWLVHPLLEQRLELGIGAGVYIAVNQQDQITIVGGGKVTTVGSDDDRVSGIVTLTGSYRFDAHWSARVSFDRLVTRYDRDADVILLGGGYRF